jgi:D-alanyl-lipoteichoic acid acyltransferase DltB (MBOAT superfamily)
MGYFFRFLFSLLTMEFILHFMYVVAMKDTKAWTGATPLQISMIGFWNLMIVWLKVSRGNKSYIGNDLISA